MNSIKKYNFLLFDLDHTLWDFEKNSNETLSQLFYEYELDLLLKVDLNTFLIRFKENNYKVWKEYESGKIEKNILRQKRFNDTLLSFRIQNNQLAQNISEKYLSIAPYKTNLIPFAKELLDNIYTKYEMIIITNGFEDVQKIKMEQTGLNKYFKKIISSDTCGYKKPEPSIFKLALNNLNGTRKESLMIGDSYHSDIWGAMQFGIDQAYLNPASQKHKYQPTYSIRCLSELSVLL